MTKWEKSCGGKFAKRLLLRPAAGMFRANNGALDNKSVIYLPRLYLSKSRGIPYWLGYDPIMTKSKSFNKVVISHFHFTLYNYNLIK